MRSIRKIKQALPHLLVTGLTVMVTITPNTLAAEQPGKSGFDLGEFWPLDAPSREWNLIAYSEIHSPHPQIRMSVENETIGPGKFILWFSHKERQAPGDRDGESYRLCKAPDGTWLYLDAYIKSSPGKQPLRHNVVSDRILFSPSEGAPVDLIANGDYQAGGATGQPYLLWSDAPPSYRIQVWGHLKENPKFRWYWDATVTRSDQVVDEALRPGVKVRAVRVEEAWWDSFKTSSGAWDLGNGSVDPHDGTPSGGGVTYGRTVWHGAGQIPYLMIRATNSPAGSVWCVNKIVGR